MKVICLHCSFLLFLVAFYAHGGVPEDYKGKPFQDSTYSRARRVFRAAYKPHDTTWAGKGLPITTRTRSTTAAAS